MKKQFIGALVAAVAVPTVLMATAVPAGAVSGARYVRYGDSGYAVKCVQWAWNDYVSHMGFPNPQLALEIDGVFGDQTLASVQQYQRAAQLSSDGVVGPLTGSHMYSHHLSATHPDCYSYIPT